MPENPEPPAVPPEVPEDRPPGSAPRRQPVPERSNPPAPPAQDLDGQIAHLTNTMRALAEHVVGEQAPAPDAWANDRSGRRVKKFSRTGTSEERPAPVATPDESVPDAMAPTEKSGVAPEGRRTDAPEFNKNVAWPRQGAAEAAAYVPPPSSRRKRKKTVLLVAVQAVGLGLLALGYVLGRGDAPAGAAPDTTAATPPAPETPPGAYRISERDLEAVNAALRAARTGDKTVAVKLLEDAIGDRLPVPGLQYERARLALHQGDMLGTDIHLDRAAAANEFVAAGCYLRARFAATKGNYREAVRQFSVAAHAEPLNGRYFFYWAETLRRMGQTQQAVDILEQARDRAITPAEDSLYLFKERLAKAEAGGNQAFNAELDAHLKEQPVPPEWLLLAAARQIAAGKNAEAGPFLSQAASALPPGVYNLWIKDFLFQTAIGEPTLVALLRRPPIPDSTEQDGPFLDPTVGPPELMDPAIWPVARNGSR